jgi:L-ascorbate metabolism protein UlaG (beta-lactamase superfamily)
MWTRLFFVLLILGIGVRSVAAQTLEVRFIGNAAVEISDGKTTLVSDFPYRSGAFGYMSFEFEDVKPRGEVLCLISHGHADHFDVNRFRETSWSIIAPKEVTRRLDNTRVIPLADSIKVSDVAIQPIETPHADVEHYSYLVTWHGFRLFFTGDTEAFEQLLSTPDLDVLFITPWLLQSVLTAGKELPAKKVVVYHHTLIEKILAPENCVVPRQGETFRLKNPA